MSDKPTTGLAWFRRLVSGKPHYVIGGTENPYMLRWYIIPRNRLFNIYLHRFLRSDDDRALHDHPWWSVSIILRGGYYEVVPGVHAGSYHYHLRRPGSITVRRATARHRIVLRLTPSPIWSLFITGPKVRDWGFWCPKGFVHWKEFTTPGDSGTIGPGCGD